MFFDISFFALTSFDDGRVYIISKQCACNEYQCEFWMNVVGCVMYGLFKKQTAFKPTCHFDIMLDEV